MRKFTDFFLENSQDTNFFKFKAPINNFPSLVIWGENIQKKENLQKIQIFKVLF
jgi:hypothetical protein